MAIFRKKQWPQVFDTTFIVACCTLMGYLCAYAYELGYLTNFDVPWTFAQVTLPVILTVVLFFLVLCIWTIPSFLKDRKATVDRELYITSLAASVLLYLPVWIFIKSHDYSFLIWSIALWFILSIACVLCLDKQRLITQQVAIIYLAVLVILLSLLLGIGVGTFIKDYRSFPVVHDNENYFVVVRVYGDQLLTMPIDNNGKLGKAVRVMNFDWLTNQQKIIELDAVKIKQ